MAVFCYRLTGTIRAVSPLHIGSGRRTGMIKHSFSFVPGSFLRGAAGVSLMRAVCKHEEPLKEHEKCEFFEDCLYARFFGEEMGKSSKVFFRFAYPVHIGCGGVFQPAPRNLYTCRNPQCKKVFVTFEPPEKCDVCGGSVKPYRGYQCSVCGLLEQRPVYTSRLTLTAIDRRKVSAAQIVVGEESTGTLHTLEVINRDSRFWFEVLVHPDLCDAFSQVENVLRRALPDVGIGGSKSRGLGKIEVEDLAVQAVDTDVLEKRAENIDTYRFAVRLLSPMILEGKMLEPSVLLEATRRAYSWAFHEGKPKLPSIELGRRAVGGTIFSGWSLKTQKRRRLSPALSAGSVFEFKCKERNLTLALGLAALEYYAIGDYKPHGCGQVTVCSS